MENDRLVVRGGGADRISGGAGADSFVFARTPGAAAQVGDFSSGADKLVLDAAFYDIGISGNFAAGDVRFYAAAGATAGHDADDRVIYDTATGNLWYDADGNGAGASQLIASTGSVAATDIVVERNFPDVPRSYGLQRHADGRRRQRHARRGRRKPFLSGGDGGDVLVGGDGSGHTLDGGEARTGSTAARETTSFTRRRTTCSPIPAASIR